MRHEELTDRQAYILRVIVDFIKTHPYPPSVRDIRTVTGIQSNGHAIYMLTQLERKGYIKRESRIARGITILKLPEKTA